MQINSLFMKAAVGVTAITATALTIGAVVFVAKEPQQRQEQSSTSLPSSIDGSLPSDDSGNAIIDVNNNGIMMEQPSNNSNIDVEAPSSPSSSQEQENHLQNTVANEDQQQFLRSQSMGAAGSGMAFTRQTGTNCVSTLDELETQLSAGMPTIYLCDGAYLAGFSDKAKGIIDHEVAIVCHEETSIAPQELSGFRGTTTSKNPQQSLYFVQSKVTFQDCLFENLYEPLWVMDDGELILQITLFRDNEGTHAGAITFQEGVGLEVTKSVFVNNVGMTDVSAGAIRFTGDADWNGYFHISTTEFDENHGGWVGGVYLDQVEDVNIRTTKFNANTCHHCSDCYVGMCLG